MTESNILNAICEYLALKRHFFFRVNQIPVAYQKDGQMRFRSFPKYAKKGVPDIIVVDKTGHFVGLEVKKKGNYQSPEQKQFQKELEATGGEYYVVHSIDEVQNIGL